MKNKTYSFLLAAVSLLAAPAAAKVALPNVFGDNMVLQQGKPLNIWGTADAGERVTVRVKNQTVRTTAADDGRWSVVIKPLGVSAKAVRFTVAGRDNSISLSGVLVGEVWLASGQSNMEYSMNAHPKYCKPRKGDPDRLLHEYESAADPLMRIMYVEKKLDRDTLPTAGWQVAGRESLREFSAAAYFFAKSLRDSLGVPVGVISSSWGGTAIETWTPAAMYRGSAAFGGKMDGNRLRTNGESVGWRYDRMIAPIAPMTLRGFLWYQGETNLINGDTDIYEEKMCLLVDGWRKAWDDTSLPFYYVQISPLDYSTRREYSIPKTWQDLPRFWDAQTRCLETISGTGMVVTTDIPENLRDIHPPYKWIVGERLARIALNKTYGRTDVVCSGPTVRSITAEDDKLVVEFDNTGGGLTTRDGKAPDWFWAKTRKGRFARVKAELRDNKVYLDRTALAARTVVRFGWDEIAQPNLINREGLPAVPFSMAVDSGKR